MTTETPLRRWEQARADQDAGLIYEARLGPELPAPNVSAIAYLRDDFLARAAGAEEQEAQAWEAGNSQLAQRCGGIATTCRDFAKQLTAYAVDPRWQREPLEPLSQPWPFAQRWSAYEAGA